jgi:hypothetical protein
MHLVARRGVAVKRYAVLSLDFDYSLRSLELKIQDDWEESVKEHWHDAQRQIREGFVLQYGEHLVNRKLQNYSDLGVMDMSIIAYHNTFFRQARVAFIMGAYYPALTGACALGERILNFLVIGLRESFRGTPEYKKVYRRQSFDDWNAMIDTLAAWDLLLPDVVTDFRCLRDLRNRAVHMDPRSPVSEENVRDVALEAIHTLGRIIKAQFGILGFQPWFIPGPRGASYIKKSWENDPFIQLVYLPNSQLVGPLYTLEIGDDGTVTVHDDHHYEDREITDDEFREMLEKAGR